MTMKCLRAILPHLFGELRGHDDFHGAAPGELLVPPLRTCERHDAPDCPCRRVFLGVVTNAATTLAVVVAEDEGDLFDEFARSPLARALWGERRLTFSADHLQRVSIALEPFPIGSIVRIRTSGRGQTIFPAELVSDEAEALQEDYIAGTRE